MAQGHRGCSKREQQHPALTPRSTSSLPRLLVSAPITVLQAQQAQQAPLAQRAGRVSRSALAAHGTGYRGTIKATSSLQAGNAAANYRLQRSRALEGWVALRLNHARVLAGHVLAKLLNHQRLHGRQRL